MKIICAENYQEMSEKAAAMIAAQVIMKPQAVLGLATGSTPIGTYRQLIQWYNEGKLDFSQVTGINLDEYRGLTGDHPQSYRYFMQRHFYDYVNIDPARTYVPDGADPDAERACRNYDQILREAGGIDLQLLGIGLDGHIGFNEPGENFIGETHCVKLTDSTLAANSRFFSEGEQMPREAYTLGIRGILQAGKVLMLADGRDKADILQQAFRGPVTPRVPASILQLHPDFTLIGDKEALRMLLS